MIITIDGSAGTGKSTVAKGVAKRLHFAFFDTGAMYRSFAWFILDKGLDPTDQSQVIQQLPEFKYEIRSSTSGERLYFVQGHNVSKEIRTQPISMAASQVAIYPQVRKSLVEIQRSFGATTDAVFEGRDMGTVVFPNADLKVFLTAKPEIRAERRYRELIHKFPDISTTRDEILKEIEKRDLADTTREVSPLKKAEDAIVIDTSRLSAHQVIEKILRLKPKKKFPKMKLSYRIVYSLARLFFKWCFRLKVYGLEHFRSGSAVLAANHTSFFDPPVLSISCPEEVHFLARESLFNVFLLGPLIRVLNTHPVSRSTSDAQTFKLMIDLLQKGNKLILFPEGERSRTGELLPLEKGLAFLVSKARCRVIPAYIHGAFAAWPRSRKWPKLFGKIRVVFGSAIEWVDLGDKKQNQQRITEQTEQAIRKLKEWYDSGAHGTPP